MLKLGVNIDHVATLRQARYATARQGGLVPEPDVVAAAIEAELAGAHGITVHLREDRRHIQDQDVRALRRVVRTRLNLEMANVAAIIAIAEEVRPDEVCLVPEKRRELTTEGGLNIRAARRALAQTTARLQKAGIAVSLFVDPVADQIRAAADTGADYIELHTGRYANAPNATAARRELQKLRAAALLAHRLGLRINAGHGLNYKNVVGIRTLPNLETLNIGHSIVARAVFVGLRRAVADMLMLMNP